MTHQIVAARAEYLFGRSNLAELTATVQTCVTLWENGMALADVSGTDLFGPAQLAMTARSLALTGEALWIVREDGTLAPATDWTISTRGGQPVAYRVTVPDVNGGRAETRLAAEVLHVRIGAAPSAPWAGRSPLARSSLSAELLAAVEVALRDVYRDAPFGSSVIPFPEAAELDLDDISRGLQGYRGRVLVRESVQVQAAGGPAPAADWRPSDLSPDLSRSGFPDALQAARGAICTAFGVLPCLLVPNGQGPAIREAQRHLAVWQLQPMAALMAQELTAKLGASVEIDVGRPLQAFDVSGRARALATIIGALAQAKEAGLSDDVVQATLEKVNWSEGDGIA
ncbi:phage portal protein [Paracoccus endophyticus]|uniref:phage portal protein n=1 Tax=Paracoccus endophyticus TaxID=2233774 RepID=UPI001F0C2BAF|nr:phage portal protein [Paracoccus endophyticus]